MDANAQSKGLRLWLYVSCWSARVLSISPRAIGSSVMSKEPDLIRHLAEEYAAWLEMLGMSEA